MYEIKDHILIGIISYTKHYDLGYLDPMIIQMYHYRGHGGQKVKHYLDKDGCFEEDEYVDTDEIYQSPRERPDTIIQELKLRMHTHRARIFGDVLLYSVVQRLNLSHNIVEGLARKKPITCDDSNLSTYTYIFPLQAIDI